MSGRAKRGGRDSARDRRHRDNPFREHGGTLDLRIRAAIDAVVREVRIEMAVAANKLAYERGEPP